MINLSRERLAVYDYGPPPGGASRGDVVFLHGMADVARSLEPLTVPLTDRYRCWPSTPGATAAPPIPAPTRPSTSWPTSPPCSTPSTLTTRS